MVVVRGARSGGVLTVVVALLLALAAPAAAASRPANDDFAAAQAIAGGKGLVYGTVAGATIESDARRCEEPTKSYGGWSDRSVWYRWTAPTNGWLRFDLHPYGGWTGYLDAFRYRGSCLSHSWAASTSSAPGAYAELEVTRGETLWFAVYSYGPANVGTFAMTWRTIPRPPPLNDHLADADVLWGRYGETYVRQLNATRQSGEPAHAGRSGGRSVWFRWTAPLSGPATFHTAGGQQWDCLLGVYTGTSVGALTPVAADANGDVGNACTARFTATAGTTYAIAVDGERGEESRGILLTWNSGPPPANDAIGSAAVLSGFHGVKDGTTRGATDTPGEPRDAETRSGSSVWYRWTAPDSGTAWFEVHSPPLQEPSSPWQEDKRIAAFAGSPSALTPLGASEPPPDEALNVRVVATAGTTYWFQVTGTDARAVHYQLTWHLTPEPNDDFAGALPLPATGSVVADTTGATAEEGEPAHGLHGHPARRSLWFRWTAPQSGTVTFDSWESTDGFSAQPALSAYTGTSVGALTRVPLTTEQMATSWRRWAFAATQGVTYRIALDDDAYHGWGRRTRLNWYYGGRTFTPPAVALTTPADGAVVGGRVTIGATASDADGVWSVGYSHDLEATFHIGPQPEAAPYDFVLDTERYADGPLTTSGGSATRRRS